MHLEGRLSDVFLLEPTLVHLCVVVAALRLFDFLSHSLDLCLEAQLVEVDAGDLELLLILDSFAEAGQLLHGPLAIYVATSAGLLPPLLPIHL